jgi:hypothetical protein
LNQTSPRFVPWSPFLRRHDPPSWIQHNLMTGIVGIISNDRRRAVAQEDVDGLARAYESFRGPGRRHPAEAGAYARFVKFDSDWADRPGVDVSESGWAASTGVVHYPGSLIRARPEDLDGQFGLVSYEAHGDQIVVASDPFGMHAFFSAERDGKTYVSTSSLALAKHLRARPNRLALETFLLTGSHFGSMSNWEGISRLDPGTCLRFTSQGRDSRQYWKPEIDPSVAKLDFRQASSHCTELAVAMYRDYYAGRPPIWSDLTGGYDTRLLNLLLREANVGLLTNTNGDPGEDDVRLAREIAQLAGWEWLGLTFPNDWDRVLPTFLPLALGWGDGHLDVLHLSYVLWAHQQKSRISPVLLVAGGGEHFQYYAWQTEFLHAGRSNRVNFDSWVDMRLMDSGNRTIFARDPTDTVRADLRTRMASWAAPYSSELNTTQLDILYAYKSTGHFGMFTSAAGGFLRAELPFYSKAVFTAAFSTNYRFRNSHRLMREIINRLDPRIAAVVTTKGGPAQPRRLANLHRFLPYYLLIARKAINKLSGKVLHQAIWAPTFRPNPRVAAARGAILLRMAAEGGELSPGSMRAGPLFNRASLVDFYARAHDAAFVDTALLGRILTIELALQATDSTLD